MSDFFSRRHPFVNLFYFTMVVAFIIILKHPLYLCCSLFIGIIYSLFLGCRQEIKKIFICIPIFLFLGALNPFVSHWGETVLFLFFSKPFTLEALLYGMNMSLMFFTILVWFVCYGKIMTYDKFTYLFEPIAPSVSLMLVMVLKLVPTFSKKYKELSEARKGIGLVNGDSLKSKIQYSKSIFSVLFLRILEDSVYAVDSMEFRGYGKSKRSSYNTYKFCSLDLFLIVFFIVMSFLIILGVFMDYVYINFYPTITVSVPSNSFSLINFLSYILFTIFPIFYELVLYLKWKFVINRISKV